MENSSYFRFDDDKTKYIFSQSSQQRWVNWKHNPIYCIMDNWENMLNLTLDKIYPTGILLVKCLQRRFHNDDEKVFCTNKRIRFASQNENEIPVSRNIYAISDRIWCNKHLRHTTTEKYNSGWGWYSMLGDFQSTSLLSRIWKALCCCPPDPCMSQCSTGQKIDISCNMQGENNFELPLTLLHTLKKYNTLVSYQNERLYLLHILL